ncbi:ankyrin repeat and SOCS box 13-like [Paramuricea clavata]|uniref:Ankyrin repeat and SOCS box 13-like n=1 Tax=Paramuricea clavata TaxID=317549 RepID=A0A7D9IP88_PARCT|nr:ankyrin repeat and SOCS box 13-like [Paramuricea clavata]
MLLNASAWVDVQESWGRTPVFLAIEKRNIDIVTLLLQRKANVHIADSIKGHTSLILAASQGDTGCMRLLLDYSADPNCQDIFGQTPLHHVVNETTDDNTEKCIRQLAAYGAVCSRDNKDRSPVDILLDKNRFSDAETMIQLTCKPRTLRSICWVKVRQNLQTQKILDLRELKIPKCLIRFIEDDLAFLETN